jgi:phosphoribosylformylglycinamidine synthase
MPVPSVLLLRTAGTNCDRELAHAFRLAGAHVDALHINALLKNPAQLERYEILGLPGGFSYGDDIASGKILANQLIHHLKGPLQTFIEEGKLILGICNGFQVLVKAGLLPGPLPQLSPEDWHPATLTYNSQGRFEDRWVKVKTVSRKCAWLPEAPAMMDLPIAHGEGRFVVRDQGVMQALKANDQIAFQYVNDDGSPATAYPALPNGSNESIAGICDVTGRVLGLMPHPERIVDLHNHPLATRGEGKADGLPIFQAAMTYLHARETVTV